MEVEESERTSGRTNGEDSRAQAGRSVAGSEAQGSVSRKNIEARSEDRANHQLSHLGAAATVRRGVNTRKRGDTAMGIRARFVCGSPLAGYRFRFCRGNPAGRKRACPLTVRSETAKSRIERPTGKELIEQKGNTGCLDRGGLRPTRKAPRAGPGLPGPPRGLQLFSDV